MNKENLYLSLNMTNDGSSTPQMSWSFQISCPPNSFNHYSSSSEWQLRLSVHRIWTIVHWQPISAKNAYPDPRTLVPAPTPRTKTKNIFHIPMLSLSQSFQKSGSSVSSISDTANCSKLWVTCCDSTWTNNDGIGRKCVIPEWFSGNVRSFISLFLRLHPGSTVFVHRERKTTFRLSSGRGRDHHCWNFCRLQKCSRSGTAFLCCSRNWSMGKVGRELHCCWLEWVKICASKMYALFLNGSTRNEWWQTINKPYSLA